MTLLTYAVRNIDQNSLKLAGDLPDPEPECFEDGENGTETQTSSAAMPVRFSKSVCITNLDLWKLQTPCLMMWSSYFSCFQVWQRRTFA